MIAENNYLIPLDRKEAFCELNRYLLLATDIDQELNKKEDPINAKLNSLKYDLKIHIENTDNKINENMASFKL